MPGRASLDHGESRPPSRRSGCVSAEPYPPLGCNQYSRSETLDCGNVYTKFLTPPQQAAGRHQVVTQNEHHQGIPLSSPRTGKTLIHIQQGAPVVEQRPLEAYESLAMGGLR